MNAFQLLLLVAALAALVTPLVFVLCAKPGYEDDAGFHYGRPPSVMSVQDGTAYICAWCDGEDAGTQWAENRGLTPSHGICPICHDQALNTNF